MTEKTIDENQTVYVNVYSITRELGGSEEGGWYFNWYECIECVPVKYKRAQEMRELLEKEYENYPIGNIYSVLGGRGLLVYIETERAASETKERPIYE